MFIHQSGRRPCGKLSEELENSFTKGNGDYPINLVSAYHLINEYKCWQLKSAAPDSSGAAFAQKGKGKVDQKNNDDSWQKKATCHHRGKIGHIRPKCPTLKDDEDKETGDDKSDTTPKSSKDTKNAKKKKKKPVLLSQLPSPKTKASPRTNFSISDSAQLLSLLL
jgi:hypothetical protein